MVHSEVYLNKRVVSIALFSPSPIQKLLFCTFSLFNFSSIFQGGQLTPFAPMCGRPWLQAALYTLHLYFELHVFALLDK